MVSLVGCLYAERIPAQIYRSYLAFSIGIVSAGRLLLVEVHVFIHGA